MQGYKLTIGLDISKSVFQVHGVESTTGEVITKRLRRSKLLEFFEKLQPSLIGVEACASSHHWARALKTLGHEVKLLPPAYVKPYVKRGKNDAIDAEAARFYERFGLARLTDENPCRMALDLQPLVTSSPRG